MDAQEHEEESGKDSGDQRAKESILFTGAISDIKPKKGKTTTIELKLVTPFSNYLWNRLGVMLREEEIEIRMVGSSPQLNFKMGGEETGDAYEIVDDAEYSDDENVE